MSRLFTQPLNGTAHMHQVAVGIFACTRTDVIYTMGLFGPDSLAIFPKKWCTHILEYNWLRINLWDFLYGDPT